MSSFLCNPATHAKLAAFAGQYAPNMTGSTFEAARMLASMNLRSIKARYPDTSSANDWIPAYLNDDAYLDAASLGAATVKFRPGPSPREAQSLALSAIKTAQSVEYQCSCFPGWQDHPGTRVLGAVVSVAHRLLPGWCEATGWE